MKLFIVIIFSWLIFCQSTTLDNQEWAKFEPLKTTRAEVERLLGKADGAYGVLYQLKDGSLFIEYSSGPCRPDRSGGWDVPENLIVSMSFTPRQHKKISQLKLDLKKLRKVVDTHVRGYVYYIDDDKGTVYSIERGVLQSIEYGPAKRHEHLECK